MSVQVVILSKNIYKRKPVERKTVDQTVSANFHMIQLRIWSSKDACVSGCVFGR